MNQRSSLQLKQQDIQRKVAKDQADIQLKKRQQDIEAMRTVAQNENSRKKDMINLIGDMAKEHAQRKHEEQIQKREIMADGLKTALLEKIKPEHKPAKKGE